jgi:hypothetical protein
MLNTPFTEQVLSSEAKQRVPLQSECFILFVLETITFSTVNFKVPKNYAVYPLKSG